MNKGIIKRVLRGIFCLSLAASYLVCADNNQHAPRTEMPSPKNENSTKQKQKNEGADIYDSPSSASTDSYPEVVFVRTENPINPQATIRNHGPYMGASFTSDGNARNRGYTFPRQKTASVYPAEQIEEKTKEVCLEANRVIRELKKCAKSNAKIKDLLALNDLKFYGSPSLNRELQKTKHEIQSILYDKKTGEFKGIHSKSDVYQIQSKINNFRTQVIKWANDTSRVSKDVGNWAPSPEQHSEEWNKKIESNSFNKDLDKVVELCEKDTFEIDNYKENLDKAKEIVDKYNEFPARLTYPLPPAYLRYSNIHRVYNDGVNRYEQALEKHQQRKNSENKESQAAINAEESSVHETVQKDTVPAERFETTQDDDFITNSRAQNYEISDGAKALLKELDINEFSFMRCYGNELQHRLHQEFVFSVNKAAEMRSRYDNAEVAEISANVATFAYAGSMYVKAGYIQRAQLTVNFCKSMLDCGYALGERIVNGALHPVETATKLAEAVTVAAEDFCELLSHAQIDRSLLEKIPYFDPEVAENGREYGEKIIQQGNEFVKELAQAELTGYLGGKIIGPAVGRFIRVSQQQLAQIIRIVKEGGEKALVLTAENIPVNLRITAKAAKNFMEKAGKNSGVAKVAKESVAALQNKFKIVIDGIEEVLPEVARLDENKIHHILQPHHVWEKLVKDPKDWNGIARVMSKVLREGVEEPHKGVSAKVLKIGNEVVKVTFKRVEGEIKVSDAWIEVVDTIKKSKLL